MTKPTAKIQEGAKVRYTGYIQNPGRGAVGTFEWLPSFDAYCGVQVGWAPGFVDARGNGHYIESEAALELV